MSISRMLTMTGNCDCAEESGFRIRSGIPRSRDPNTYPDCLLFNFFPRQRLRRVLNRLEND